MKWIKASEKLPEQHVYNLSNCVLCRFKTQIKKFNCETSDNWIGSYGRYMYDEKRWGFSSYILGESEEIKEIEWLDETQSIPSVEEDELWESVRENMILGNDNNFFKQSFTIKRRSNEGG